MDNKRDLNLDLAKVISTLGVLALHSQRCSDTGVLYNPLLYYIARFSMPVFFMVNGYLILKRELFDKQYYIKKLKNVLRVLLLWSLITFLLSFLIEHNSLRIAVIDGIKCMLGAKIVPFWFLFTLILIYSFLLFKFEWVKQNINLLLIILGTVMILLNVISLIIISSGGYFIQQKIDQRFRIWTWLFYFLVGYKVKTWLNSKTITQKHIIIVSLVTLVSSVVIYFYQYYLCAVYLKKINSEYLYDSLVMIIWCVSVFILINIININKKRCVIPFLSVHSFGLFLLHGYFLYYLDLTRRLHNSFDSMMLWILLIVVCYAITWAGKQVPYCKKIFEY